MKKNIKKLTVLALIYGGLIAFLCTTNPNKLGVGWLIVPFVWMFVAFYFTVQLVLDTLMFRSSGNRSKKRTLSIVFLAATPTFMLLLGSIDQLTVKDGLLIVALGGGALFYTNRLKLVRPGF